MCVAVLPPCILKTWDWPTKMGDSKLRESKEATGGITLLCVVLEKERPAEGVLLLLLDTRGVQPQDWAKKT